MSESPEQCSEVQPEIHIVPDRDSFENPENLETDFLLEPEKPGRRMKLANVQLVVHQQKKLVINSIQVILENHMAIEMVADYAEAFFDS
jgi:hypothetical protein